MIRLFLLLTILHFSTLLFGKTWVVSKDGANPSIKTTILKAQPGDTLLIKSGYFKEGNIIVNKSLVLIGQGLPVIDGENKYENFTLTAPFVTLQGLKIINTGISDVNDISAITGESVKNLRIIDNIIEDAFFGIHLKGSTNSLISGNKLKARNQRDAQSGNGIHLWKCDSIRIINNTVEGHRDGIYFEFVTHSVIQGNVSHHNLRYGLHFMFSHNDEYRNNTFKDNGAGVAVMFSKKVKMFNNLFMENWGSSAYGLLLKEISDCIIENNRFYKNTVGIYLEGVNRGTFANNQFRENGWAVKLQASSIENVFEKNNFVGNTFDLSTNGSLTANRLDANYWDKYDGYDMGHDGIGDIPFHPVSVYSMIVEKMPTAVMLWRSFLVFMLDRAEKLVPVIIPENLRDDHPQMKAYDISS